MNMPMRSSLVFAALLIGLPSIAQAQATARPEMILKEVVSNMPKGERQEVRVLTASFKPGDKTVFHTHGFPVPACPWQRCLKTLKTVRWCPSLWSGSLA